MDDEVDWALVDLFRVAPKRAVQARVFDAAGCYEHLPEIRQRWIRAELARGESLEAQLKAERRERWHGAWGDDPRRKGRDVVTAGRFCRDRVISKMRRVASEHRGLLRKPVE